MADTSQQQGDGYSLHLLHVMGLREGGAAGPQGCTSPPAPCELSQPGSDKQSDSSAGSWGAQPSQQPKSDSGHSSSSGSRQAPPRASYQGHSQSHHRASVNHKRMNSWSNRNRRHEPYPVAPYPLPNTYYQQPSELHNMYPLNGGYSSASSFKRRCSRGAQPLQAPQPQQRVGMPTAPDRFLAKARKMVVTKTPESLLTGGVWDKLSQEIWKTFMANQQTEDLFMNKMLLWKRLYTLIKSSYPRCGVYMVGSTLSCLGSKKSDVDICLVVRSSEVDQRREALFYLSWVMGLLQDYMEDPELIQAKVPILKFRDVEYGIEVDLNCNNAVGIHNTRLLYCYANLDWRVKPLVLLVKLWAQKQGINDAKKMTISSYSLALMVINYLQCGTSPAMLPSLQLMHPERYGTEGGIQQIDMHEDFPHYRSENSQTLGELLLGFLDYYTNTFDFAKAAISVRLASTLPIEECKNADAPKNDPHQWKYLCVEEPFELTNTARSVYDRFAFERIKSVFHFSWMNLKSKRTLDSIFEPLCGSKAV